VKAPKTVWTKPARPRLSDELRSASRQELIDDTQWTRLTVTDDLTGESLGKLDVSECRLSGCRLTGSDLQGSRFVDCEFVDCELSGVTLADAVMTRVSFSGCRMSGAILTSSKLRDVTVAECKADEMGMRMAAAERTLLERTILRDADFYSARLDLCRLFDCDLSGVQFSKTVFSDVRLHGSTLDGLRGIESIRGVTIDPQQMHDFTLSLLAAHDIAVDSDREQTTG
jgi:uncharacterized protein YjbI with pentapeptide repeats